jgi:predicted aldo/keto reductase-like oxidoreductase
MEYRQLGSTGKSVSAIGLGCEHLDNKPYEQVKTTIDAALEAGVNLLDVFMPGQTVREHIARALGPRRKEVMIQGHIGATDINQQYDISRDLPTVQKYFEELLRIFGGYIDFGMLFFIDSEKDYQGVFETGFIEYAQRLKRDGYIGHIGFSSHNPATAKRVIETGVPELMMFSINPAFDLLPATEYVFDHFETGFAPDIWRGIDPQRMELYKLCDQKRIGITVMKTFGAAKLISKEHTPFAEPLTIPQCVHYALTRPAVASILPGCKTPEEVQGVMRYFELEDAAKDYSGVLGSLRNDFKGSCVYCSHCQPCPSEIDIAAVNKYLDIARLDTANIPPSIRSHYSSLAHKGGECIECGSCEERCPFGVPVIDNMKEAENLLGNL